MKTLTLNLKKEYFCAIKDGYKCKEYREITPYWEKRIKGKQYDQIVLCSGYPPKNDGARRIVRKWRGYTEETITHPHFGNVPTRVFAIDVSESTD